MPRHWRRPLSLGFAFMGLATAAISMGQVWRFLDSTRNRTSALMWPFPALYLIEVVALSAVVLVAVIAGRRRGASFVAWAALGALTTMALLGAMTIGATIAIPLIFLVPASILSQEPQTGRVSHNVAGFVVGVLLQAGVMFSVIQILLRRPMYGLALGLTINPIVSLRRML